MKYSEAKKLFETARDKVAGKPVGNNTRLVQVGNAFGIKLHDTVVVKINSDNTYEVYTGGWNTLTTRDRVNTYLPRGARLTTERGIPMIAYGWISEGNKNNFAKQSEFYEGIKINSRGKVVSKIVDPTHTKQVEAKLQRSISKYIRNYLDCIAHNALETPSGGDCWVCSMKLGDDIDHLFSHIEENYYVPSLLVRAMEVTFNPDLAMYLASTFFKNGRDANESALRRHSTARHALQRYFRKRKSEMLKRCLVNRNERKVA